jgi:hypothetical protein
MDLSKLDVKSLTLSQINQLKEALAKTEKEREDEIRAKLPEYRKELEAYALKKCPSSGFSGRLRV